MERKAWSLYAEVCRRKAPRLFSAAEISSTAVGSSGENGTRKRVSPFAVGLGHTSTGKTEPSIAKCKCRSAGITLHAAVDYAIKRMNLAERSKTLREVADFVIAYKHSNGSSPRHLKGMRSIFSKVCEDLGERQVNEITREAIEEWQAEQDTSP